MRLLFRRTSGQRKAYQYLESALKQDKLSHALLFYGPPGGGQTALVLDVLQVLLCESPESKPCGECRGCRSQRLQESVLPLIPLEEKQQQNEEVLLEACAQRWEALLEEPFGFRPTPKERISIGQVRALKKRLGFAEMARRRRLAPVFFLETMLEPAANALLKLLEEPPPNVIFLIACENRAELLPTLLSRCVQIPTDPYSPEDLKRITASSAGKNVARPHPEGGKPGVEDTRTAEALIPFCDGAPGTLMYYKHRGSDSLAEDTLSFLEACLQGHWLSFSSFLEESSKSGEKMQMENILPVLRLSLEMVRWWLRREPDSQSSGNALVQRVEALFSGKSQESLFSLAAFLENAVLKISRYGRPDVVLLGEFLSRDLIKASSVGTSSEEAIREGASHA